MNIEISENAALSDAKQIDSIIAQMQEAMDELNSIINNKIGGENSGKPISTRWGEEVTNNWKSYYTNDIPETMNQMKQSATNLRLAVEQAVAYSKGN